MTESAEKRKIRRIVMVAGGVETLEYFAIQMAERFRELGYSVFFTLFSTHTETQALQNLWTKMLMDRMLPYTCSSVHSTNASEPRYKNSSTSYFCSPVSTIKHPYARTFLLLYYLSWIKKN